MESEALKYGWLIILTLVQIIYVWMKIAEKRNGKKNDKPPNPGKYGERIASLETDVENIKEDIREIKRRLNRK
ncbi:MAG: hypothetical protein KAV87_06260 [Desulfobacteraceae bacterium]|nr:hypothetical protein [Desulfobacteraceae bacterium]